MSIYVPKQAAESHGRSAIVKMIIAHGSFIDSWRPEKLCQLLGKAVKMAVQGLKHPSEIRFTEP
ncbi:MAG: hypothetical protein OXC72_12295 [Roseovarius sp.]|nr:hypothetical protein [Roseovarius sp.]